jgi:predicted secreted protein
MTEDNTTTEPRRNRQKVYLVAGIVALLAIVGLVLALSLGGGESGPSGPGVYSDPSRTIKVKPGDEFSIELESNASTGFSWVLTGQFSSSIVKMVNVAYRPPDPPVYGTPGTDVWKFQAVAPGKVTITLGYMNTSVTPSEKADEKSFKVEVK